MAPDLFGITIHATRLETRAKTAVFRSLEHLSIGSNTRESCVVKGEVGTEELYISAVYCPDADVLDHFSVQKETKLRQHDLARLGLFKKLLSQSSSWKPIRKILCDRF